MGNNAVVGNEIDGCLYSKTYLLFEDKLENTIPQLYGFFEDEQYYLASNDDRDFGSLHLKDSKTVSISDHSPTKVLYKSRKFDVSVKNSTQINRCIKLLSIHFIFDDLIILIRKLTI